MVFARCFYEQVFNIKLIVTMKQFHLSAIVLATLFTTSFLSTEVCANTPPLPAATGTTNIRVDTLEHCLRMHDGDKAVYIYHGVPYAHAERFRAPIMTDGIEPNDTYTHSYLTCYQRINYASPDKKYGESHVVLNDGEASPLTEDCLVLTVNSPYPLDHAKTPQLPVFVYIHGGNYYAGGGEKKQYSTGRIGNALDLWEFGLVRHYIYIMSVRCILDIILRHAICEFCLRRGHVVRAKVLLSFVGFG